MDRDNKGRFKKKDDELEDENEARWLGFLERTPNTKILLVLLLLVWLVGSWSPKFPYRKITKSICPQVCSPDDFDAPNGGEASDQVVTEKKGGI
jgi:hypothetical protein